MRAPASGEVMFAGVRSRSNSTAIRTASSGQGRGPREAAQTWRPEFNPRNPQWEKWLESSLTAAPVLWHAVACMHGYVPTQLRKQKHTVYIYTIYPSIISTCCMYSYLYRFCQSTHLSVRPIYVSVHHPHVHPSTHLFCLWMSGIHFSRFIEHSVCQMLGYMLYPWSRMEVISF